MFLISRNTGCNQQVHTYTSGSGHAMPLRPEQVNRSIFYGGEDVIFTKDEVV